MSETGDAAGQRHGQPEDDCAGGAGGLLLDKQY
jgi:hypothetical protein